MERELKIHPNFLKEEKYLMTYIHHIVSGLNDDGPFEKDSGYKWQLDASNNWWAEIRGDKLIIASRYGGMKMETLCAFVETWLR